MSHLYKSEDQFLSECFTNFWNNHKEYRGLLFHPANELPIKGRAGMIHRMQMKGKGVVPGVPDFVWMGGRCAGLEAKLPGESPSDEQYEISQTWRRAGRDFFFFETKEQFDHIMSMLTSPGYQDFITFHPPKIYNYLSKP